MFLTWKNYGAHVLHMKDDATWSLYADLEYETASISLKLEDRLYEVADAWELLQGREHMPLDSYDVLEFYDNVIIQVAKIVSEENVQIINLEDIKEELLRTYWWPKWRAEGRVTDDLVG